MFLQKSATDYPQHPEGIFGARVVSVTEDSGQWGPSIKFVYRTEHKDEMGEHAELWDYVSNKDGKFSPSKTKLVNRLTGIMGVQKFDQLPEGLEIDDMIGKLVQIKVFHNNDGKARIESLLPYSNIEKQEEGGKKESLLTKAEPQPPVEQKELPPVEIGFEDDLPF